MVHVSGFRVDDVLYPACDASSGYRCTLYASRDADRISMTIAPPGTNTGLDHPPEADVIITITAQR
jgi:hypothetical protein